MMTDEMLGDPNDLKDYGWCMGVIGKDGQTIVPKHNYKDGKKHFQGTGICQRCLTLYNWLDGVTKFEKNRTKW